MSVRSGCCCPVWIASAGVAAMLCFGDATTWAQSAVLKERGADARSVVLDVIAKPGLEASGAVVVTDNGKRVPPEQLGLLSPKDGSDAPAQLVFVIDALNASFPDVGRSEDALEAALKATHGSLPQPTSVVVLSDVAGHGSAKGSSQESTQLHQRQLFAHRIPASTDAAELLKALSSYKVGLHRILESQAGPGQSERVRLSLQALSFVAEAEAGERGAKVLVWIGPGWPFLSPSNARSSEQLFDSIVYFSDLFRSARILLYSVSPEGLTSQDHSAEAEGFLLSSRPGSIEANGRAANVRSS